MHRSSNHNRHRLLGCLSNHVAVDVTAILQLVSRQCRTIGRSKLQQIYYDPKRVGSYSGVAALRKVCLRKERRTVAVGTGCVHASQTGETSLQTPLRRSGRSEPAVAGRPSRHVTFEEVQRWNYVSPDGDRCIFETGLVHSVEKQIGGIIGSGL